MVFFLQAFIYSYILIIERVIFRICESAKLEVTTLKS